MIVSSSTACTFRQFRYDLRENPGVSRIVGLDEASFHECWRIPWEFKGPKQRGQATKADQSGCVVGQRFFGPVLQFRRKAPQLQELKEDVARRDHSRVRIRHRDLILLS